MERGDTGRYEATTVGGEAVRAFVPAPLPPVPPLAFDGALQQSIEAADLAVGRLDGVSTLLPDKSLFSTATSARKRWCRRRSTALSSLSDLLLYELDEAPG